MNPNVTVVELSLPGPNQGNLIAIVDATAKTISLVEVIPNRPQGNKMVVWEVQSYAQPGA